MKKTILLFCLSITFFLGNAQGPDFFNYQAVLRNNIGNLIVDETVNIRISIINNSADGDELYQESHTETTNSYGAVNLQIGNGTVVNGTFEGIDWSVGYKYLKVEVEAESGYVEMGTFQLLSVPYALYSNLADSARISGIAEMSYNTDTATYSDSARIAGMSHSTNEAIFADSARVAGMAYQANSSVFSDSAAVSGLAHSANTALFANEAQKANVLGSNAVYSPASDTLFVVKDNDGNVVFAVFPDGAQVIVNETVKGKVGGFAVSGRNPAKATDTEILRITQDSTRIYVNDTVSNKGKVGGFAVSGRNPAKNTSTDILFVTADSTRVYVNEDTGVKGKVGGFAVSGRNPAKGTIKDYLQVTRDSTRVYVEESATKGKVGGFAVSGRNPSKGTTQSMFVTTIDSTRIFTQDTIGGFGVYDSRDAGSSYMHLTPLNYFIGHNSGQKIEYDPLNPGMGKYNTFFGYKAGENTVSGFKNIFMGYQAGQSNVSGGWNIFIGNEAGSSVTNALSNIFIGDMAGSKITDGINNIFIGKEAGLNSTSFVSQDLFIGHGAGRSNIDGGGNVYLGISAGYSSTGDENTFVGKHSGFSNTGSYNIHIGSESGIYTGSGTRNIYIGYRSGRRMYGTKNIFIGNSVCNTVGDAYDYSNSIALGDSVIITASNQIRIGNSSATSFYIEGAHNVTSSGGTALYINSSGKLGTVVSSKRYKTDITDLEINTSNIYNLKPVSYTLKSDNKRYFGLIAEDVAEEIPGLVEFVKAKDVISGSTSEEMIPNSVHYPILSVLLLKEIQEHEKTIKSQSDKIKNLEEQNNQLEERIKMLEEHILK